jgi:alpha-beta hydrolase superfamily lysophospholipase
MRHPTPQPPDATGTIDGLAYALFLPSARSAAGGGIVILHGAGSCKESHFDFARAARAAGLAAVAYDQRGHGASAGPCDGRLVDDVATVASLLPAGPVAVRGSSMGGYVALLAGARIVAAAVAAICPAPSDLLLRGLRAGEFDFEADVPALERFLASHPLEPAVEALRAPLLLMHARGDERVPVESSEALLERAASPVKRLIAPPGGHHRSIQHDAELQGESLRFLASGIAAAGRTRASG